MKAILEEFYAGKKRIVVGNVDEKILKILDLDIKSSDVVMWSDRLDHIEKHKFEYESVNQYESHINMIPDIIGKPDYIGRSKNNNGLEFVKRLDEISMIAVRINKNNKLFFRSLYPITESKLNNRIKSGRWVKYK